MFWQHLFTFNTYFCLSFLDFLIILFSQSLPNIC